MIDSSIHDSLREKFNPDGSPLRKHQMSLLSILKEFDLFCKKNDINYWLSCGTCLGAIRHSGFIPWDDDVDVEMLYKDYVKFIALFKETDNLVLQTYDNDLFYTQPFAKLRMKNGTITEGKNNKRYKFNGPFIDVFCLEHAPYYVASFCHLSFGAMRRYSYKIGSKSYQLFIFKKWKQTNKFLVVASRWLSKIVKTENLRYTFGTGGENMVRREREIFPLTEGTFEGYTFPIPGNYHLYLKRLYGDYMTIPDHVHTHSISFNG